VILGRSEGFADHDIEMNFIKKFPNISELTVGMVHDAKIWRTIQSNDVVYLRKLIDYGDPNYIPFHRLLINVMSVTLCPTPASSITYHLHRLNQLANLRILGLEFHCIDDEEEEWLEVAQNFPRGLTKFSIHMGEIEMCSAHVPTTIDELKSYKLDSLLLPIIINRLNKLAFLEYEGVFIDSDCEQFLKSACRNMKYACVGVYWERIWEYGSFFDRTSHQFVENCRECTDEYSRDPTD
jgi:hypothetical protein